MMKKSLKLSGLIASLLMCYSASFAQTAGSGVDGTVSFRYPAFTQLDIPFENCQIDLTFHTVSSMPINTVFIDGEEVTNQVNISNSSQRLCTLSLTDVTNPNPIVTMSTRYGAASGSGVVDSSPYKVYVLPNSNGEYVLTIESRDGSTIPDDTSVIITTYRDTNLTMVYNEPYKISQAVHAITPGSYRIYIGATLSDPNAPIGKLGNVTISGGYAYAVVFPDVED